MKTPSKKRKRSTPTPPNCYAPDDAMKALVAHTLSEGRGLLECTISECIRRGHVTQDMNLEERKSSNLRGVGAFRKALDTMGIMQIKEDITYDEDGRKGDTTRQMFIGNVGMVNFTWRPVHHKVHYLLGTTLRVVGNTDMAEDVYDAYRLAFPAWLAPAPPKANANVYMMIAKDTGLGVNLFAQHVGMDLDRRNYDPVVLAQFDSVVEGLNQGTSRGRLTLLDGPPGTGKTHMILGMMNAAEQCTFVYVFQHLFGELSSPALLPALVDATREYGRLVLVIEDADTIIAPRAIDNAHLVSFLLNMCDGILGRALDIHVIATSNATKVEVDKAALRKRRLQEHIHVPLLDAEHATSRLHALVGDPSCSTHFTEKVPLANVYDEACKLGWKPDVSPGRQRLTRIRKRGGTAYRKASAVMIRRARERIKVGEEIDGVFEED